MKTQPKVSILIPVYNTACYLPKCLDSVINQTLREIEIIVVNDASPDNAAEVLAGYAAKDDRIKVITHEKNGGILAARLSGIAAAHPENRTLPYEKREVKPTAVPANRFVARLTAVSPVIACGP